MSALGEGSRASTPESQSSEDSYIDDDRIPGILKGLIDQRRLQGAWTRVSKRLRATELNLAKAQQRLDALAVENERPAYKDLVEDRYATRLASHEEALERLKELTGRLSSTVFDEQHVQLQDSLQRLKVQEDVCQKILEEAQNETNYSKEFRQGLGKRLDQADVRFEEHVKQSMRERTSINEKLQESTDKLWKELRGGESRMQAFIGGKVDAMVKTALRFDKDGADHKCLLDMIDRDLVDTVRKEHAQTQDKVIKLMHDVDLQKAELVRQLRVVEQKATGAQDDLDAHKKEIFQDLEKRSLAKDMLEVETLIRKDLTGLNTLCEGLESRTIIKLNEFVDHIVKLHETIDDHEHCLRHHAEEIENRSTKYDLLLCQSQIDKCVNTEQYGEDLGDLKKVVAWQTNKIENFGLGMSFKGKSATQSAARKGRPYNQHGLGRHSIADTPVSESSSMYESGHGHSEHVDPTQMAASQNSTGQDVAEAIRDKHEQDSPSSPRSLVLDEETHKPAIPADDEGSATHTEGRHSGPSEDFLDAHLPPTFSPDEELSDTNEVSDIDVSAANTLGQQVEALAMALVGVAHLLLAPPKLGMSLLAKDEQKSEMLAELGNLRHWITQKMMPPEWDPSKLATMALRFQHQEIYVPHRNSLKSVQNLKRHMRGSLLAHHAPSSSDDESTQQIRMLRRGSKAAHHLQLGGSVDPTTKVPFDVCIGKSAPQKKLGEISEAMLMGRRRSSEKELRALSSSLKADIRVGGGMAEHKLQLDKDIAEPNSAKSDGAKNAPRAGGMFRGVQSARGKKSNILPPLATTGPAMDLPHSAR